MEKYVIKKVNSDGMSEKYLSLITTASITWTADKKRIRFFSQETAMVMAEWLKKEGINCIVHSI